MENPNLDDLVSELAKKLIDEGRLIEAGFQELKNLMIPPNAPQSVIDSMRIAFFAGAQYTFGSFMKELNKFVEELKSPLKTTQ